MKEFESLYRRELRKEFWHIFRPILYVLIPLSFLIYLMFADSYTALSENLEQYIGNVNGAVTDVNYRQRSMANPRVRRTVKIEIENGDVKMMLNDTLKVGDEIILEHWTTSTGRDYYGYPPF